MFFIARHGNGNENVPRKYIFFLFVLLCDYFNSLNFYKNGELSRNQIGRSGVQVKKENEKFTVVRSRSLQNLKCGHFTLLFCRGRQRNVSKCKTHVQIDCFCSLNPFFLRRCRCRRRRWCLRWLTTVFPRLSSARYDSLPHVSICRACKNDASNLKK